MPKIERAAAYVRVSTQEQKLHGLSLDAQKMKLNDYADSHNLKIVEWYMDEGVSGRKRIKNRPELQRMINDAQQDRFDRIIFIKLDLPTLDLPLTAIMGLSVLINCSFDAALKTNSALGTPESNFSIFLSL